jgi:hypothetical protein
MALDASREIALERHADHWLDLRGAAGDLSEPENRIRLFEALMSHRGARRLIDDVRAVRAAFADDGPHSFDALLAVLHASHATAAGYARWGVQLGRIELVAGEVLSSLPGAVVVQMVRRPEDQLSFGRTTPGVTGWRTGMWIDSAVAGAGLRASWPGVKFIYGSMRPG